MPAPTQLQIKNAIIAALPSSFKSGPSRSKYPSAFDTPTGLHKDQLAFIDQTATDLASAWISWIPTLKFGGASVLGSGIGVWAGTGGGGQFLPSPLSFTISAPLSFTDPSKSLVVRNAIAQATVGKFTDFNAVYTAKAGILVYTGSTTATPLNPGVFAAVLTPITLFAAIAPSVILEPPADVATAITNALTGFNQANIDPAYYSAYANALDSLFNQFLGASSISANSVAGPSVAGTGTGAGISLTDGIVT